jgi:hypothetical protein
MTRARNRRARSGGVANRCCSKVRDYKWARVFSAAGEAPSRETLEIEVYR